MGKFGCLVVRMLKSLKLLEVGAQGSNSAAIKTGRGRMPQDYFSTPPDPKGIKESKSSNITVLFFVNLPG